MKIRTFELNVSPSLAYAARPIAGSLVSIIKEVSLGSELIEFRENPYEQILNDFPTVRADPVIVENQSPDFNQRFRYLDDLYHTLNTRKVNFTACVVNGYATLLAEAIAFPERSQIDEVERLTQWLKDATMPDLIISVVPREEVKGSYILPTYLNGHYSNGRVETRRAVLGLFGPYLQAYDHALGEGARMMQTETTGSIYVQVDHLADVPEQVASVVTNVLRFNAPRIV